ncbi:unnamed protein product [Spirodela intermedia]|uniref:GPI ethanolamine phosphate transferase 2 C-terminal domain-containing protein n=1 Tax=Spirodela intermedia TaxID=51605 RepID=A0A7I8J4F1_SPIIN|nr:unnamed protein product [Spirodela intermedia]CAA6664940.1 unnamed protein product [Spirodela intermedia]
MPSSMACTRLAAWTVAAVLLQILGLYLFMFAFFPVRPALSEFFNADLWLCDIPERWNLPPHELRAMYKVVDGLPAEFILGKGETTATKIMADAMPYTHSLLSSGKALGYHALAATPTVTMPRLKAIVSGIVGGKIGDLIKLLLRSLLGDEKIRLFPGRFIRQDGVKDTVEVDFNVSRHLESELAAKDWDLLILHYLGLDHVGHIGGRNRRLDSIFFDDCHTIIKVAIPPSLPPLQVDIAPTLAILFGLPIPKNSVGLLIREVSALYFIGMTGHFGLGNSNTLATIDVAGAFNGIFGQSTVLAGIMMLIITYASPLLYLLSLVLYISLKTRKYLLGPKSVPLTCLLREMLVFPCLVPLALNSISLTSFTIILFAMRNHLFIWSVFSPKYLYVCAATVCVYVGLLVVAATISYICAVVFYKRRIIGPQAIADDT